MNASPIYAFILASYALTLVPACKDRAEEHEEHEEGHRIVVTSPIAKDVTSTQQYVAQIHSRRHIEVRALESGYLQKIHVKEGQHVNKGNVMFNIVPVLYQASLDTEMAEAEVATIRFKNTEKLTQSAIVSNQELALAKAELAKAKAKVKRALAELNFTSLKAPFDGIIDRQYEQEGSLVDEGDILSTLSDNQVMWVYFNVPEARYLDYKAHEEANLDVELKLANGEIFKSPGKIGAIEADFDNQTGNIAFRADFPNPAGLLRHGQTGNILIHKKLGNAIVIPQRATYEILAKQYVYVVEPDGKVGAQHPKEHTKENTKAAEPHASGYGIVRQREIVVQEEMDDIYVIKKGLSVNDRIIFEGARQVRHGDRVKYDFKPPQEILSSLKYHAE